MTKELNPLQQLGREITDQYSNGVVEAWQLETLVIGQVDDNPEEVFGSHDEE